MRGIHLHGSYILGSYNENCSDLDYIIVVKKQLTSQEKENLMQTMMTQVLPLAPEKGVEWHVLLLKETQHIHYPVPFDFHFSNYHYEDYLADPQGYVRKMHGTDPDLAVHLMITKHYGKCLIGKPIERVFSEVSEKEYWRSVWFDIRTAQTDVMDNPIYVVLNLCRSLAFKEKHLILSKKDGGIWALSQVLNKFEPIIQKAIHVYAGDGSNKERSNGKLASEFTDYVLNRIKLHNE